MIRSLLVLSSVLLGAVLVVVPRDVAQAGHGPLRDGDDELDAVSVIDRLIEAELRAHGERPNAATDDATFVRRIYLDIIGRIPTIEESRRFLASKDVNRRRAVIDELLSSPGHTSHMLNFWADLLRAKSRPGGPVSGEPYLDWLRSAVADNRPYDDLVRDLLTASGPAHARGNGATGYYLRDRGMPLDNMATTMRVFLGTRLECAQCHDHPFDRWTQKEFYELAAFTGGIRYRNEQSMSGRRLQKLVRRVRQEGDAQAQRRLRQQVVRPMGLGVAGGGTGAVPLPDDYAYENARPGQLVTASTPFGPESTVTVKQPRQRRRRPPVREGRRNRGPVLPEVGSRDAYADWVTSPQNERFTRVIVNRMWKRVMGRGLIEPVDDLRDDTQASHPELLRFLEELMVELDYDLRAFERVLLNTKTYQRQATVAEVSVDQAYRFSGPLLRRMTAEQVWDSLLTLAVPDPDATLGRASKARVAFVYESYDRVAKMSDDEIVDQILDDTFRSGVRSLVQDRLAERKKRLEELRPLLRDLRRARQRGDRKQVQTILDQLKQLGVDPQRPLRVRLDRDLLRASELGSPAPAGHLLRQFGQSDRDQVDAANTDPNVPQALSLMNGFVDAYLTGRSSALARAIAGTEGTSERIETAFVGVLARKPRSDELRLWTDDVRRLGGEAWDDLVWTLVNTREFVFVQ